MLKLQNLLIGVRAEFQRGKSVQLPVCMPHYRALRASLGHAGVRQLFIVENYISVVNEAVVVQHSRKGLCKYRFAGTRLPHYGNGLIFVNIKGYSAYGGKYPAAHPEFYKQILNREQHLFFICIVVFHCAPPYICVLGSEASPRF